LTICPLKAESSILYLHCLDVSPWPTTHVEAIAGIIDRSSSYATGFTTLIFDARHADYLLRLCSENLSNDELAARLSKQFRVRITAGQVGALLTRMRRPGDAIYRAVPYRRAGSRSSG
jgi:hypothetical protein